MTCPSKVFASFLVLALSGCHLVFPFDLSTGEDSALSVDGRPDGDGGSGEGHAADAARAPDLPANLRCGAGRPCCSPDRWCWENPLPLGYHVRDLWGSASNDLWAAGSTGTLMHYDGSRWSVVETPAKVTFYGIWGTGPKEIYAVGEKGTILRYDGATWAAVASSTTTTLNAVWGSGPSDLFAVGFGGTVVHFDGTQWSTMPTGLPELTLGSVWGAAPDDLYATAINYTDQPASTSIVHYDGTSWKVVYGPHSNIRLNGIWGSGPKDVFAIGGTDYPYSVVMLHFDGSSWKDVPPSGAPGLLRAIWGAGASHAVAVGMASPSHWALIYRYDGTTWSNDQDPVVGVSPQLLSVWSTGPSNVYAGAIGGQILRHDGSSWSQMIEDLAAGVDLRGVWGSGADDVFAVGGYPSIVPDTPVTSILHFDGLSWSSMPHPSINAYLSDVWGSSGSDVWVVGAGHAVLRYDGKSWSKLTTPGDDPKYWLEGVWGTGTSNLFVAGGNEALQITSIIRHHDGVSWTTLHQATGQYLYDIWGSGPSDLFAVGYEGTPQVSNAILILHSSDGKVWTKMNTPSIAANGRRLRAVWGNGPNDVYAVGGYWEVDRLVMHYTGGQWTEISVPGKGSYFSTVWGSGPSDVYITGYTGSIVHYDGNSWQEMTPDLVYSYGPSAIWGSGPGNLYAVGPYGMILHRK